MKTGYIAFKDGKVYVNPKLEPQFEHIDLYQGLKDYKKALAEWEKNHILVYNGTYNKDYKTIIALPPDFKTQHITPGQKVNYSISEGKATIHEIL